MPSESPAPRNPPPVTDVSRAFWSSGATGTLLIQRCSACRRWAHPPVDACPACGGALTPEAVSGRGTVFTFTINRHPFSPDVPVPYVIAIVELDEQPGLRFTTNVVDCDPEDVEIGMRVEVGFEPAGDFWAPVFRPSE